MQLSTTKCLACGSTLPKYDMWQSLSLSVPQGGCQIETLLNEYWGEERLTDLSDRCFVEGCRVWNRRVLITEPKRWPQVLIVHLKRWRVVCMDPFTQRKVDDRVDYEMMLPSEGGRPAYNLRGVVVHHGAAGVGHYIHVRRSRA